MTLTPLIFGIDSKIGRVGAAALVGGIASTLVGGKFAVGAYLGAFSRWFNDEAHEQTTRRGSGWFGPDDPDRKPIVGRSNTPVEPGGPVGDFCETRVPGCYGLGVRHDSTVDYLTSLGVHDLLANIPTMLPVYLYSIGAEILNTPVYIINTIFGMNYTPPYQYDYPVEPQGVTP